MQIVDWHKFDDAFDAVTEDEADVVWQEEPVGFREFNESTEYLNGFPLSERQYYDVEQVISMDPKNIFSPERLNQIGVLAWGKGSGKDLTISRLFCYVIYLLFCMCSPQRSLWMSDESVHMDILNVARKGGQAREIFFSYFKNTVKKAPYFRNRFIIREANKIESQPTGTSQGNIDIGGGRIEFPKNIRAHAETSAFEGYEGYNLVLFVMDEASAFKSATEQENAQGIYRTLRTSGSSRSTRNFQYIGFVISYPRQAENDLTLDLYNRSFTTKGIYGSFGWSWMIKPAALFSGKTFTFSHSRIGSVLFNDESMFCSVEIPIEYETDFIEDPTDAMCKHLCVPPRVQESWVEYPELFYEQLDTSASPLIEYAPTVVDVYNEDTQKYEKRVELKLLRVNLPFALKKERRFVAWLDAADTYCDACVCIAHLEMINKKEYLVQDANLVWRPEPSRNLKISLVNVEEWITSILPKNINLIAIGSDYWNSSALSERMKRTYPNIRTIQANLNEDDYKRAKKFVYTGQTRFKFASTVNQLVTLKNSSSGKPRKTAGNLQDQADGWVGVVKLLKGGDAERLNSFAEAPSSQRIPTAGIGTSNANLFSQNNPFNVNQQQHKNASGATAAQRIVHMSDVRKLLNVPDPVVQKHKPWNSDDDDQPQRRLPMSTVL